MAAKKKVAPSSDSEQSDVYSSSDSEASDGYSSSEDKSDTELSNRGLSEYELLREQRIARNNARLAELGLGIESKEAKTNVVKKRKSLPVNEPLRVSERKRNAKTYNEDYTEDVY